MSQNLRTFDCSISVDIPEMEIDAVDAESAKRIYIEAVKRLIASGDPVLAVEVDVVD